MANVRGFERHETEIILEMTARRLIAHAARYF
jgi:hypothetical protein